MTAHGGRCRASACGTAGWSASAPGAPPRRAARPRLTEGSGHHGDQVELGMNIVSPATLMLDWWDELWRVAGLKVGWVTASLVIANTGHLRDRRGEALAHQASCLTLVTNAVMVWNTVSMAAAVEQLNAFSRGVLSAAWVRLGKALGRSSSSRLSQRLPRRHTHANVVQRSSSLPWPDCAHRPSGGGRFAGRPGGIAADLLASPADSSDRSCTAGRCMVFH